MGRLASRPGARSVAAIALIAAAVLGPGAAAGAERLPAKLRDVDVKERLGQQVAADARFTDHRGRKVRVRDFLDGERPVLLTLNYYRCANLCNLQLNALTKTLAALRWKPGENFRLVTISIDHREKAALAKKKRSNYLHQLGRGEVDWTFLVGDKDQIARVARSVGFGFRYDAKHDQYAHPALLTFLSPAGKISRYLYGIQYSSQDLKFAIIEASEGRVGSTVDRLILSCFHYDASEGRYGPYAFGIMRLGGVLTVILLGAALGVFWLRERRRRVHDAAPQEERDAVAGEGRTS